ncbi:PepSY domain-containing protein [Paenisporosarcina sp. OV554]|uniref:PepSY-associated TM helix domain-containing protein n=1 Tax=Paenisporosarcina sp. OV554 TaxID=2135694 RepID=UPI000D34D85B|nr:PepSY domain-containing protein [Paenisporosarcina sp. OV554]PUB10012.1 putative iron-regulated membrane protein [Paenisporosarcina sp. OV554]
MSQQKRTTKGDWYKAVWRWHFYAGILFAPIFISLAISGGIYLFKPQIEAAMYQDLYEIPSQTAKRLAPSALVEEVTSEMDGAVVTSIRQFEEGNRTTEIRVMDEDVAKTVYVNPYDAKIVGEMKDDDLIMNQVVKIHSELLVGGSVANLLVELAAGWAIILMITGLYVWWPRGKPSIWGTVLPRFRQKGRLFWRDMHGVTAFWLSGAILIILFSGLAWSTVSGDIMNRVATSTNTGNAPLSTSYGEKPPSSIKTDEIAADVPWATQNLEVPTTDMNGFVALSIDEINDIAVKEEIAKPYTISLPAEETGVFTITSSNGQVLDEATLHVDPYTGFILSDARFADYGIMAKAMTAGISFHEGRLFGVVNQIIGTLVCLGIILIVISSFIMWRKRKPATKSGAPSKVDNRKVTRVVWGLMIVMGILMPLVGISLIVVFIFDKFILPYIPKLKDWLQA